MSYPYRPSYHPGPLGNASPPNGSRDMQIQTPALRQVSYAPGPLVQPMQSPQGSAQSQAIESQAVELVELRRALSDANQHIETLRKISQFPQQFKAGVVDYPNRRPFPIIYRNQLINGSNTFGFAAGAAGEVQMQQQMDAGNPFYLNFIQFGLIRTNYEEDPLPAGIILNTYLPLGGVTFDSIRGLDFEWRVRSSADSRDWDTNWRDSSILDFSGGYVFPAEIQTYSNEVITLEARPYGSADAGVSERFALYGSFHGYKMYEVYPVRA